MDGPWRAAIAGQFGAALDMLENAMRACPESVWGERPGEFEFGYLAFHTLFWLDYYLADDERGFRPPAPYTLGEIDPAGVLPERLYTRDELLVYLAHGRTRLARRLAMTDAEVARPCGFERRDLSAGELLLYNLRHVQHHVGQLQRILRERTGSAPRWVGRGATSLVLVALLAALLGLGGCSSKPTAPRGSLSRAYAMGFAAIGPNADFTTLLNSILMWSTRADGAIMSNELPWDSLLAGVPIDSLVIRQQLALAQYYRGRGFQLLVMIDPANGLNRGGEATALVTAGRSITEPAIQQLYRRYVVAVDTLLKPDQLGLALETNLIRYAAPPNLYAAVWQMSNAAAADVRAVDPKVALMVSVQAEAAWGRLQPTHLYVGVNQDYADFPFLQILGVSSYPYLGSWMKPEDLPPDYYSRLTLGHRLPVILTEGGWSSRTVSDVVTSPALQRRYIVRQAQLLAAVDAAGWYQLTFTDLDPTVYPPGIAPFAYNGLVDSTLAPKPALAPWDSLFALPRR